MTLKEFFDLLAEHPGWLLAYFALIPFTALLSGWIGKGEGHLTPWKFLYSALIFLVCIPGIFAVTLDIYLFLFERRSIMETDVYTQVLPVASMILSVFIIRRNVDLDVIPGFDKLSGLVFVIATTLAILWFIDRTHIIVFSYLRIEYAFLIFIGLLLLLLIGWRKMMSK